MNEIIRGDVLTKQEMSQRGIQSMITERGGLELRITDNSYLAWLLKNGFAEPYHEQYINVFMELRDCWLPNKYKPPSFYEEIRSLLGDGSASEKYDIICHEIKPPTIRIITHAATTSANNALAMLNAVCGEICLRSFDVLVEAMDNIRKKDVV